MGANEVLEFWFSKLTPADWFAKSDALDAQIKARFANLLEACSAGECWQWRVHDALGQGSGGLGRLAEIIVLDQF